MNNFESLLFYLGLFSLSSLILFFAIKRRSKILTVISLAIPIIIGGLRFDVGTDYNSYTIMYEKLSDLSLPFFLSNNPDGIEAGFFGIIKLSELITQSPEAMFVISSALTVIFTYLGIRKLQLAHPALSYFLFLTILYPITFNAVRQGISIAICFYAFTFMAARKERAFIVWLIIAALFHTSAIFMLPVYALLKFLRITKQSFYNQRYLIKILSISIMLLVAMPFILHTLLTFPLFEKYVEYGSSNAGVSNTTIIVKFVTIIGILALYRKLASKDRLAPFYLTLALLELATVGLWQTSYGIFRISLYLSFFSLILLANTVDIFSDKYGKYLMYALLVGFGLFYFYVAYYVAGQADIMPYNFIGGK